MQKTISILQTVAADKSGYEFLCELYNIMHVEDGTKEYIIDFKKTMSFDANLSAVLGAIFDKRNNDGYKIFLIPPVYAGVRRVLSRNKFFEAFDLSTKNEDRENFIVYKSFGVKDTLAFKQYIETELIQKQSFPKCTKKAKDKIKESIYEIFANAVDHGGCDNVYCCGEVHTRRNKTTLDMTFVNLGMSVVDNVNRYMTNKNLPTLSSEEALVWAFEEGNTTKQITGGLGLAILQQFIRLNKGRIQMISGDAMLEIEQDVETKTKLDKWFYGTIVTVEFDCNDENSYYMKDEIPDTNNLF